MCACARVWMCRYACTHACLWKFLWLPQYVCLWLCCYFAWWLNSRAVAEHRAVLGCHFSSFADHWDSWGEASIWAVRRWRETWCWVTDTCIEWLCPVRTPVVLIGEPGPQVIWRVMHPSNNSYIYSTHPLAHTSTHAEEYSSRCRGIGIHTYRWVCIYAQSYAATNVQAKTEMNVFTM